MQAYPNGLKQVALSGDGVFVDETAEARLNTVEMQADPVANFEIVVPDFGTYAGEFRCTSLEFGGETEGGMTFSTSLESNGAVTFTAACLSAWRYLPNKMSESRSC